ncbi:antigen like protein, partial [Clarias magur]
MNVLSAEPEISVSGPVGSTAVLPCELTSVDTDRLYIRWNTESEIVFERLGERSYQDEGYEGRVDVPVEELRKGNCSLVLHNLTPTDTGVYTSYQTVRRTKREPFPINSVKLSVYGTIRDVPPAPTGLARTAKRRMTRFLLMHSVKL